MDMNEMNERKETVATGNGAVGAGLRLLPWQKRAPQAEAPRDSRTLAEELFSAVLSSSVRRAKELVREGVDWYNARNGCGFTAPMLAHFRGERKILEVFQEREKGGVAEFAQD